MVARVSKQPAPDVAPNEQDPSELVRVCPSCGETGEADGTTCRRCWRGLHEVIPTLRVVRMPSRRERLLGLVVRRRRRFLAVLVVVVALFWVWTELIRPPSPIGQPPSLSTRVIASGPEAWPTAGGDLTRSRSSFLTPDIAAGVAWRVSLGAVPAVGPVTDGSLVFIPLLNSDLVALELETGHEVWRARLPGPLDAPPTVAGDAVYVGLRGGSIMALDASTGEQRWSRYLNPVIHTSPLVVEGLVFVASSERIHAVDAEDGTPVWSGGLGGSFVAASPVISNTRIVVATNERVLVLDRRTGAQRYFYQLANPMHLAVDDGVIFASGPSRLLAIDPDSTTPWWEPVRGLWANFFIQGIAPEVPLPAAVWWRRMRDDAFAPALADGRVVVAWPDGLVRSYDQATGSSQWEQQFDDIVSAPTFTAAGVLVANVEELILLDSAGGEPVARRSFAGEALRDVVVVEAGVLISTQTGELLVLR